MDDYKAVNLTIDFNNGKIKMSNGVFTQEMNALSAKGFGVLKLRLPVGAFDKSVLDKDAVIRFYFDISKRIMFITDADNE